MRELRVLVVDDHPINRLVCKELLQLLGCSVDTAEDGEQALEATRAKPYDLICLDRHMPGMHGDDVLARLPADQFVVAWSTDSDGVPPRFNGWLDKPISIPAAAAVIDAASRAREAAAQARLGLRAAI